MQNIRVISLGERSHYCDLPGWFRRWRMGFSKGAIISCTYCGRIYRLESSGWKETLASKLLRNPI